LSSFLVVCSDMISKGFGLVAFFASVKASSVCIHLSCLACIQSVVHGVRSRLFCGHKGCRLTEVSITSFMPLQFSCLCKAVRTQFSDPYKNVGKTKVLYIFKTVSVITFLKIVLLTFWHQSFTFKF
jgi:low affinity Fe/Cu permease